MTYYSIYGGRWYDLIRNYRIDSRDFSGSFIKDHDLGFRVTRKLKHAKNFIRGGSAFLNESPCSISNNHPTICYLTDSVTPDPNQYHAISFRIIKKLKQ
jgi:hypothetical protein